MQSARPSARGRGWFLRFADERQADGGGEERDCVGGEGEGCADPLDQDAGEPRPPDLGGRSARLHLAVPLHQARPLDQDRQIGLIGKLEEGAQGADQEAGQV